jgi:hypothetical protein
MAIISIEVGETLTVMINGTDHEFEIHNNSDEYDGKIVVVESGGVDADEVGSSGGVLYATTAPELEEEEEEDEEGDDEEEEEGDDEESDDTDDEDDEEAETK